MARFEVEILDHVQRPKPRRIARAEIAVDIVFAQSGIRKRASCHVGMDLRERQAVGLARRVLEDACDRGPVPNALPILPKHILI